MYVDNCFTIEKIFVQPEQNGTAASETDMDNDLKVPFSLKINPLEKAQHSFRGNQYMLMLRYKNKKDIYFLSTIDEIKTWRVEYRGRNDISTSKLTVDNNCNKNMGGVDHKNLLTG